MKYAFAGLGALGVAGMIFIASSMTSETAQAANLDNGKSKFLTNCQVCHGNKGWGDGPAAAGMANKPANISKKLNSMFSSDTKLTQKVMDGKPGMPAFKGVLNQNDVADIFAYIRSMNP
ncbi:c-type cytochrome [Aliamphritea hakodatensis]|uniref:c-type cytochrome n=1 Tax=Aliamphritea hakodatensis TaxID=2895352 RepID=UPI0022FDA72B|nr:cytochrome c [Aliamphritea hakodatensis]